MPRTGDRELDLAPVVRIVAPIKQPLLDEPMDQAGGVRGVHPYKFATSPKFMQPRVRRDDQHSKLRQRHLICHLGQ